MTKNNNRQVTISTFIRLFPIIVFMAIVIIIVHVHEFTMPLTQFPYLMPTDETIQYDFFSYYKACGIGLSAIIATLLMLYYFVISKSRAIRKSLIYIPILGYLICIVLSCVFSEYRYFALFGTLDRFEGTLVHLCYIVMLVYIYNCIDSIAEIDILIDCVLASTAIANLIGLSQAFCADFYGTKLGSYIIAGSLRDSIVIDYPEGYTYQTVANPNYVGFYLCIILPILLVRIVDKIKEIRSRTGGKTAKNHAVLISYMLLFSIAIINVVAARAMGPIVGISVGVLMVCVGYIMLNKRIELKKAGIILGASLLIVAVVMGVILTRLDLKEADVANRPELTIATHDNTIDMQVNGIPLNIVYDSDTDMIYAINDEGQSYDIEVVEPQGEYGFGYDGLRDIITFETMSSEDAVYVILTTFQMRWPFAFDGDGVHFINPAGNLVDLGYIEHANVIRDYRLLNGRGYIWDTALAFLGDYIFIGAGADTFMMVFPQNDYVVRYLNGLDIDVVTDKPHNLFIQIWASFGLLGLIMFAGIVVGAIFVAGKKCAISIDSLIQTDTLVEPIEERTRVAGRRGEYVTMLTIGITAGVIGYLITGLVNDSTVGTMPLFYGALGLLLALSSDLAY